MNGIVRSSRALMIALTIGLMLAMATGAFAAPDAAMYARCAKACSTCMAACKACNTHCEGMVKAGMKQHQKSAAISADCRDLCDTAAKVCARKGPLTAEACKACLEACQACDKECKPYPKMKPMADCAKACAVCEKACADMIAALK